MIRPDEELDLSYLTPRRITKEEYLAAYKIYLEIVYPNDENGLVLYHESRNFNKLPNMVNGGPHGMKMVVSHGKAYVGDFFKIVCDNKECGALAYLIEKAWREHGLPVGGPVRECPVDGEECKALSGMGCGDCGYTLEGD